MKITKATGQKENFNENKIKVSLRKIGAKEQDVQEIVQYINRLLYPGKSSRRILEEILTVLHKKSPALAVKYGFKNAMMDLGPSGYPFEKYIARLFKENGYRVKVGQIIKGYCVDHEVDVVAEKRDKKFMVECKYHNNFGARTDLRVALYTYARFLDIKETWEKNSNGSEIFHYPVLVTNTKCTSNAINYARCRGLKIISWHYPANQSLEKLAESKKLYPVTSLFSLDKITKNKLLKQDIVLLKDLVSINIEEFSRLTGVSTNTLRQLQKEAIDICNNL